MWVKMNLSEKKDEDVLINLTYIQRIYIEKNGYDKYEIRGFLDSTWEHPFEILALCNSKEEAIRKMDKITQYLEMNGQLV